MLDIADTYNRLITLLDQQKAHYRLIGHEPEGRTEIVSPMRGNGLAQAAKCMVVMVKLGKKVTKYVLAVVPGDTRIVLNAVKALFNATYVSFATPDIAERLIAAGYKVLSEKGYEATTVKEVTQVADVSPGLFHYYFASKDELLLAVLNEAGSRYGQMMRDLRTVVPADHFPEAAIAAKREGITQLG